MHCYDNSNNNNNIDCNNNAPIPNPNIASWDCQPVVFRTANFHVNSRLWFLNNGRTDGRTDAAVRRNDNDDDNDINNDQRVVVWRCGVVLWWCGVAEWRCGVAVVWQCGVALWCGVAQRDKRDGNAALDLRLT